MDSPTLDKVNSSGTEPIVLESHPAFDPDSELTERAIPIRPSDLVRNLAADPGLSPGERTRFLQFARILGAVFHYEYYDWLVELKDLYSPLDPDSDCVNLGSASTAFSEEADEAFLQPFEAALIRANYRPLKLEIIEKAVSEPNEMGLTYQPDFAIFEHLKVFVRGRSKVSRIVRNFTTKFRKREYIFPGYSRLVVILKFRAGGKKLDRYARSDVIYLRLFKDVPHVDMEMHLPEQGTKVKMRLIDKAQIASPMFTALPLLAAKIFLGWVSPLAFGVLIAPFTAGANSFFGFQRAKQKHLANMIRHLYYLTLANNGSVINRLVDSAEEEDFKEALLAYFFLWRGQDDPSPWDQLRLDRAVEVYLKDRTGQDVDFEVADAAQKLVRLGLVHSDSQARLTVTPIESALERLDQQWDDAFRYHESGKVSGDCSTKI
ncbi:MAG: hypothetical protein JWN86_4197 [Planctomycetota bacterium]|nr:hypothetical protein [Planctomycetota bacterium]